MSVKIVSITDRPLELLIHGINWYFLEFKLYRMLELLKTKHKKISVWQLCVACKCTYPTSHFELHNILTSQQILQWLYNVFKGFSSVILRHNAKCEMQSAKFFLDRQSDYNPQSVKGKQVRTSNNKPGKCSHKMKVNCLPLRILIRISFKHRTQELQK